jgi:hypothetical protein
MPLSLRRVCKFVFTKVISIYKAAEMPEESSFPRYFVPIIFTTCFISLAALISPFQIHAIFPLTPRKLKCLLILW